MTETRSDYAKAAERVIEQTLEAQKEVLAMGGAPAVGARLQIAILAPLLRAIALEADMATSREDFVPAAIATLQTLGSTLSGYLGEGPGDYRKASMLLLSAGMSMASGEMAAAEFNEKMPFPKRGTEQ